MLGTFEVNFIARTIYCDLLLSFPSRLTTIVERTTAEKYINVQAKVSWWNVSYHVTIMYKLNNVTGVTEEADGKTVNMTWNKSIGSYTHTPFCDEIYLAI